MDLKQEKMNTSYKTYFFEEEPKGPLVINGEKQDLKSIYSLPDNKAFIDNILLKYGGLLLRNFSIHSISEFSKFAQGLFPNLLEYSYRSSPRTCLGGKIYTSTDYPSELSIPLHNENSYAKIWPRYIMFFCALPSTQGGETPVADSRKVFNRIDKSILKKFKEKGICYLRNYTEGLGLNWKEVFQTTEKSNVEKFCNENGIEYKWKESEPVLRTKQTCPAYIEHPITKEIVWFNQAHLFHVTSLPLQTRNSLISELGIDNLPRNAFYGDGLEIELNILEHIREAYEKESTVFRWEKGDIMILDNILMAHGRKPYVGERKIAVAMA